MSDSIEELENQIKTDFENISKKVKILLDSNSGKPNKKEIRESYLFKRKQNIDLRKKSFINNIDRCYQYFADGEDVNPEQIEPYLEIFDSKDTLKTNLFTLASLHWSVPVSNGYGRRIRCIVWDKSNQKIIGIIALGDPVFNLRVRDEYMNTSSEERKEILSNCLDAYVLGAIPPYNKILCGKLITCLLKSKEIYSIFYKKYNKKTGVIDKRIKNSKLLFITTSSSMGKSSVYNRLKINGENYFKSIGYSQGWGHYHIPDELFEKIKKYLVLIKDNYADTYKFNQGPNFRIRVIRKALSILKIKVDILKHGIKREVFICELFNNSLEMIKNTKLSPNISELKSYQQISNLAKKRWVIPRSKRSNDYLKYKKNEFFNHLGIKLFQKELDFKDGLKKIRK